MRQWGGLGKSREWTGGCEGLVCNCVDCSNRGTLPWPCPVDLYPRRLVSQYAAERCLRPGRLTVLLALLWPTWPAASLLAHYGLPLRVLRVCRYAATQDLSNAPEGSRQIDSRAGRRKNTDNEQAQARSGFRPRSAQPLHASTPQAHVEAARRRYSTHSTCLPKVLCGPGGWTIGCPEPTTDGDGRPFLPSLPVLALPPLRQVPYYWAPPALTDEKKRRNPGLDEQMDARRSHPITPHHFTAEAVARPQRAGYMARRTLMPLPCLAEPAWLCCRAAAGCTLLSGFRITLAHTPVYN